MDILPLLDELQTLARNGLAYTTNPYDKERYERLLELATLYYGKTLDLLPDHVKQKFAAELGYITPKVGGDTAIFDNTGKILLVLRTDDQQWCLPCGWVEPGESPARTAVRETKEETGLEVRVLQLVDVFTRLPNVGYGPHTAIAVVYLCEIVGGRLELSHEHTAARYWNIDKVPAWHELHEQYARAAFGVWQVHHQQKV
jgi:ADP-ribose pyrophosphatase YjhB (NUDIX family)